jgi:hypothetical protein
MKTLLEFKNEVAVGYGCESWRDMFMEFRKQEMNINPYFNDAAEKYANQFKEENERLRAEKKELLEALTIAKVTLVEFYTNDYVRKHGLNEEGMQKVLNSKPVFLIVKEAIEKHSGAYEKRSI